MRGVPTEIQEELRRYATGPTLLRDAIAGIDPARLNRRPPGEDWSPRDVVIHLADAEVVRAFRLRIVIAEDDPVFPSFDEKLWKRRLHYLWRDPEAAIALYEQSIFSNAELLEQCEAATWQRTGIIAGEEAEPITVRELMRRGIAHAEDHAAQIRAMRE